MTFPNSPIVVPQFPGNELENASELVARVDVPLNEIQAYIVGMPLGLIVSAVLATTTTYTTTTNFLSVSLPYVAGRFYRCTLTFVGTQGGGTTGAPGVAIGSSPSVFDVQQASFFTRTSGTTIYGTTTAVFAPVTSGTTTVFGQVGNVSASVSLAISAQASLEVEDIGFP